jgi:hypothetical protein
LPSIFRPRKNRGRSIPASETSDSSQSESDPSMAATGSRPLRYEHLAHFRPARSTNQRTRPDVLDTGQERHLTAGR